MTQEEIKQINDWMMDEENIKKLSLMELAKMNLYFQEYVEKIAPIVIAAMSRDGKAKYLFKL